jgi:hypothetical protein
MAAFRAIPPESCRAGIGPPLAGRVASGIREGAQAAGGNVYEQGPKQPHWVTATPHFIVMKKGLWDICTRIAMRPSYPMRIKSPKNKGFPRKLKFYKFNRHTS